MRKLLQILIIFLLFSLTSSAQWTQQNSGTTEWLRGVDFLNESYGIAVGTKMTVRVTNDGGENWNDASGSDQKTFYDIELRNDSVAFLVGEDYVYGSNTGGQHWSPRNNNYNTESDLRDIEFSSDGSAFIANQTKLLYINDSSSVLIDENASLTTNPFYVYRTAPVGDYVYATVYFDGTYRLYKAKEDSALVSDGWTSVHSFSVDGYDYDDFYLIDFPTEDVGFMAGSRNYGETGSGSNTATVEKTTDGGENFEIVFQFAGTEKITSIHFIDEMHGWVVVDYEGIFRTIDGGENWTIASEGITRRVMDIVLVDENVGYAVGFQGAIFKTTNGGGSVTSVEDNSQLPNKIDLAQNYPNPFNPSTTISYSVPKQSNVSLKVYNVLGKEVAELVDTEKSAGSYEVEFNAENLSSGIYFYKLKTNNSVLTKKMMLIK